MLTLWNTEKKISVNKDIRFIVMESDAKLRRIASLQTLDWVGTLHHPLKKFDHAWFLKKEDITSFIDDGNI